MVTSTHPLRWQAPQPLWARFDGAASPAAAPDQARPAILRFATDDFMDQVLATLARDPARLDGLLARPETWRTPAAAPAGLVERTPVPRLARAAADARNGGARGRVAATAAEGELAERGQTVRRPLKLYHPAHQRFYLVAASLVCGVPGFPERAVAAGGQERVGFVIRRLLPVTAGATETAEFAYVKDDAGARWRRVERGAEGGPVADEEVLPVFPLAFHDEGERARTLWSGMVPVGRREEFMAAAVDRSPAPDVAAGQLAAVRGAPPAAPRSSKQARVAQFQVEVAEPWKILVRASHAARTAGEGESADARRDRVFDHNLRQQHTSWLVLLDFADYLAAHLPDVWSALESGGTGTASLPAQRRAVYDWLGTASMPPGVVAGLRRDPAHPDLRAPLPTLRDALRAIRAAGVRERLERTELAYTPDAGTLASGDWPPFHFVLAGLSVGNAAEGPFAALAALPGAGDGGFVPDPVGPGAGEEAAARVDRLTALVGRALEAGAETGAPPVPFALQLRDALQASVGDAGWYVARFVYTRCACGPMHPPVLSAPTQRFQLASFFDPDAPARPVRITLPLDTSPAGLRKFNRNTAFVISDMLCGQIQRAKGLGLVDLVRAVLPWPLHKDLQVDGGGACKNAGGINIGMICSLSIPIITICALILLIIMVTLLDLIFRWLPWFIMCFPLPRFRAKEAS
jgi:hypothetical protein